MDCRICKKPTKKYFELQSQRHDLLVPTFYCKTCNAFFSDGGPVNYDDVDLTDFYLKNEFSICSRYQKIFEFIESLVSPGRFLDIGAGMGFSLTVANSRGWTSTGLEPNTALVSHAQSRKLNLKKTYLSSQIFGEYDFILIDNVLEHVHQPLSFLKHATRLLAPTGIMLIAVPPMDWLRQGLGKISYVRNYVSIPQLNIFREVDEHVNIFSRKAMINLLSNADLYLLDARFHHSLAYNNILFRKLKLDDGYFFATKKQ